jgi:hypothetical protein
VRRVWGTKLLLSLCITRFRRKYQGFFGLRARIFGAVGFLFGALVSFRVLSTLYFVVCMIEGSSYGVSMQDGARGGEFPNGEEQWRLILKFAGVGQLLLRIRVRLLVTGMRGLAVGLGWPDL